MTRPHEQRLRLFVAVELGEEALHALGRVQAELRERRLEGLRWVRTEGIHLTLKFLGEVPSSAVGGIEEALGRAVEGVPSHQLSLGALGKFGSRLSPRVLWVDLRGDVETLLGLQARVGAALAPLGFPGEQRAFSPHLTLARARPESARRAATPLEQAIASPRPLAAKIEVREVSLMRSQLNPGGAVYTRLKAFPLG